MKHSRSFGVRTDVLHVLSVSGNLPGTGVGGSTVAKAVENQGHVFILRKLGYYSGNRGVGHVTWGVRHANW